MIRSWYGHEHCREDAISGPRSYRHPDLHPGYFAFVMATGIVSTGTFLLGPSWLSRALLAAAAAGFVILAAALAIRLAAFRASVAADIQAPERVSASSRSWPAATCQASASRRRGIRSSRRYWPGWLA
jgi:tellurite resistance protein TehA-like permease